MIGQPSDESDNQRDVGSADPAENSGTRREALQIRVAETPVSEENGKLGSSAR